MYIYILAVLSENLGRWLWWATRMRAPPLLSGGSDFYSFSSSVSPCRHTPTATRMRARPPRRPSESHKASLRSVGVGRGGGLSSSVTAAGWPAACWRYGTREAAAPLGEIGMSCIQLRAAVWRGEGGDPSSLVTAAFPRVAAPRLQTRVSGGRGARTSHRRRLRSS